MNIEHCKSPVIVKMCKNRVLSSVSCITKLTLEEEAWNPPLFSLFFSLKILGHAWTVLSAFSSLDA